MLPVKRSIFDGTSCIFFHYQAKSVILLQEYQPLHDQALCHHMKLQFSFRWHTLDSSLSHESVQNSKSWTLCHWSRTWKKQDSGRIPSWAYLHHSTVHPQSKALLKRAVSVQSKEVTSLCLLKQWRGTVPETEVMTEAKPTHTTVTQTTDENNMCHSQIVKVNWNTFSRYKETNNRA